MAGIDPAAPQGQPQPEAQPQPQSQPQPPVPGTCFQTGQHYRVHKSYIWAGPLLALGAVLVVLLLNGASEWIELAMMARSGQLSFDPVVVVCAFFGGIILIWLAIMGVYAVSYKHMSYVFDPREFSYYSGVFVKKRVHIPYEKVQSVNQRSSLLQRILGVCSVTIDSAGGSSNKGVRIPYVALKDAEGIRNDLFSRKAALAQGAAPAASTGAPLAAAPNILDDALAPVGEWRGAFGGAAAQQEAVSFEYSLSNKELVLASISHPGPLVVAVVVALCMVGLLVGCLLAQEWQIAIALALAVPVMLAIVVASWVVGSLAILVSYGGFKVRRRGTRIEVERGLITRHFSGIDVGRIQSVDLRQSVLRRLLSHSEVLLGRIDAASQGGNEGKNEAGKGLMIYPFLKNDQLDALLDGLLPEFADRPRRQDCAHLTKKALGRNVRRRCLWFNWVLWCIVLCVAGILGVYGLLFLDDPSEARFVAAVFSITVQDPLIALAVAALAVSVAYYAVSAVLWARHSRYGWNGRYLLVHNDGLATTTTLIPRSKIQCGLTRDNPFQRRCALTTLTAITAAGVGGTTVRLLDIPVDEGAGYLEWLQ